MVVIHAANRRLFSSVHTSHSLLLSNIAWYKSSSLTSARFYASDSNAKNGDKPVDSPAQDDGGKQESSDSLKAREDSSEKLSRTDSVSSQSTTSSEKTLAPNWEDDPDWSITQFSQLPHQGFGYNQHMKINEEFKEALRQMLWNFKAPIRYAFAYGSGVFSQSKASASASSLSPHPNPPEAIVKWQQGGGKVIDFIFGVTHTHHWHSLNIAQHPDHYSFLRNFGSGTVSRIQDNWGAGVYFNPYITLNGTMIKYGVVNLDTLRRDLSQWDTLYLAGRLQKPVKILRDDPKIRMANQINLISALRTALLMLGPKFSERELYTKIAGISYMGDPRMQFKGEDPNKVKNIVSNQLPNFRQLYAPLVEALPNVAYNDSRCHGKDWILDTDCDCSMTQDMDTQKRGNMVRRLPVSFRNHIYMEYRKKWQIPGGEFNKMMEEAKDEDEAGFKKRQGGDFDKRIASEADLQDAVISSIRATVKWPSWSQSFKGLFTGGFGRAWKYMGEKLAKGRTAVKSPEKDSPSNDKESKSS